MKATMPADAYQMEFMAEFIDESVTAFPYALLDAAEDSTVIMET